MNGGIASAAGICIKVCTDIIVKISGHMEAPAKFIPGQGQLLSPRKKTRPDSFTFLRKNRNSNNDLAKQPKSNVSRKNRTAPENKPSDTLEEMVPRIHLIFKQVYHYCFCGVLGKRDTIKEAHSRNFNRSFLTCAKKERGCRFFQWIS